jgi:chromate transporter
VASAVLAAAGTHELLVLLGAGAVMLASKAGHRGRSAGALLPCALVVTDPGGPGLAAIFAFFLKVGSVLYGTGYVLLSFLRSGLVERGHWITEAQLLDAVAIGQVTPGPVFTTATFVGYLLGGVPGGAVATVGIFLPAFVLVGASGRLIPLIRRSRAARAFLDGVVAGSLGLLALVTWQLARAAIDGPVAAVALLVGVILLRAGVNSAWLILAGAAAGPLLS